MKNKLHLSSSSFVNFVFMSLLNSNQYTKDLQIQSAPKLSVQTW